MISFPGTTTVTICVLLFSTLAFGWGRTAHKLVGEIAEQHLTAETKIALKAISVNRTLAKMSTWADEQRGNRRLDFLKPYHYVSIKDGDSYDPSSADNQGDIIKAIEWCKSILKGQVNDRRIGKKEALALLVHFIGDLHQPLHVGRKSDRGGNSIRIMWFGRNSNLHSLWDSGIIDHSDLSYSQLLNKIHRQDRIHSSWFGKSVIEWSDEQMAVRDQVYTFNGLFIEPYLLAQFSGNIHDIHDETNETMLSLKDSVDSNHEHDHDHSHGHGFFFGGPKDRFAVELGQTYYEQNWPLIQTHILKGGVRLAETLNQIFDR